MRYCVWAWSASNRGRTYGDYRPTLELVAQLRDSLRGAVYGVLGNHDSIRMVPDLEALGIAVLFNECIAIRRGEDAIYLAGVDDAHFYRADNIEKAATEIPERCVSILLSHTPEIYRQAAHAGFDLMLSGHTHMEDKSVFPGAFRFFLKRTCRALSERCLDDTGRWSAIRPSAPGRRWFLSGSTTGQKSRCIISSVAWPNRVVRAPQAREHLGPPSPDLYAPSRSYCRARSNPPRWPPARNGLIARLPLRVAGSVMWSDAKGGTENRPTAACTTNSLPFLSCDGGPGWGYVRR
jgi:hypothetical protein